MGMFDTVIGTCPKCGGTIDCQFKSGACCLLEFNIDEELDIETAASIDGLIVDCDECGSEFYLDAEFPIDKIKLKIKPKPSE